MGVSVRIVPRPAGATLLASIAPATASVKTIGMKRANEHRQAAEQVGERDPVGAELPGSGWK